MQYLSVKNLTKYQHYKHRNPPWIKFYREFWTDYTIRALPVDAKLLFLGLCSLAAESENKIPADVKYLSDRLGFHVASKTLASLCSEESTLLCLYSDSTLREHIASTMLADSLHDASKTPKGNGKTAFPKDWTCDEKMLRFAEGFGMNGLAEFEAFKDHAYTNNRHCSNWLSAYRNWVRKSKTSATRRFSS